MANSRGRPKVPEEMKCRMVYARLNPQEIELLDRLCRRLFITRSGLLRKAFYDLADKEIKGSVDALLSLPPVDDEDSDAAPS